MILKDLLKTLDGHTSVRIEAMTGGVPIIVTKAASWRFLDDGLLDTPIAEFNPNTGDDCKMTAIRLATPIPVYVSTAAELQAAMDDSKVFAIALAADINADDNVTTLLTFNSSDVKSLDLNGYMLAATNADVEATVIAIEVSGGGTLNIYDSQGSGEVFGGKHGAENYAIWIGGDSMCNIYGGYFTAAAMGEHYSESSSVIYAWKGKATVYGGYFCNESYSENNYALYATDDGSITCYGGVIADQNPTEYLASGKRIEESQRYYEHLYRVIGK